MYKTEQEDFWASKFGDEYTTRNMGDAIIASNTALFSNILMNTSNIRSVIEFGANIGLNLVAISRLLPNISLSAVELNKRAADELKKLQNVQVFNESILDFTIEKVYDFVLIKTVLIHICPDYLPAVYEKLYHASCRYICLAEYYNPIPVEVEYRGHKDKLYKRNFSGEMLDKYPDLNLVDYGFVYHRDSNFPQDDITWFLLEKTICYTALADHQEQNLP